MRSVRLMLGAAILILSAIVPETAFACRCWVGDSETTDQERIDTANQAVSATAYAVIGTIRRPQQTNSSVDDLVTEAGQLYSHRDAAVIEVDKVINGAPLTRIVIPENAGKGVYDGRLSSNLLGTCGLSWRDGETNVWLILEDGNGDPVLASSCAHSLVRQWLYPEFGSTLDEN